MLSTARFRASMLFCLAAGTAAPAMAATPPAATSPAAVPTPAAIVAQAPASAWHTVPPDRLLVMDMSDGRRLLIELAPDFAPVHVANIRLLARNGWWDGAAIVRVQDNYVVQWSQMPERTPKLPGFDPHPPAEYDRPAAGLTILPLPYRDPYAPAVGFAAGWPVGTDGKRTWLAHCYGSVGVGRDMPPDTGDGSELYAVNGQAPRQLDRNIALVGRVVGGMDWLSALPRGQGTMGFYSDARDRIPIADVRLASDLPPAQRPVVQVMDTASPAFHEWIAAKANRRDPFFVRPADGLALCDAVPPSRVVMTDPDPAR